MRELTAAAEPTEDPGPRRGDARAVCLLLALTTIAVAFRWYYDNWLSGFDMFTYFLSSYEYIGQRVRDFDLPAWNPHQNAGYPAAGDPGAGWLYLPVTIGMAIATGGTGVKLMVLFQALIAAIGTFGFLRTLGMSTWVAFLPALAYATGAPLYDATGQSTVIGQISTFLPLGFLGLEAAWRATRRSARWSWSALAGLAAVQMFLAWPQGFMYGAMMMAGWLAWRVFLDPDPRSRDRNQRLRHAIESGLVLAVSGGLFGLGGILPRLEFTHASNIPGGDYADVIGGNYVEWRHTWVEVLSNLFSDDLYWRIMIQSAVILLLAALAVIHGRRAYGIPFFALMLFLSLDLSVDPSLTRWAFYLIPPFELVHHHRPTAAMYMAFFPLAVLAGAGLQLFLDRDWTWRHLRLPAAITTLVFALVAIWGQGIGFVQPAVFVIAIAALWLAPRLSRPALFASLAALILIWPNVADLAGAVRDPANAPEYNDLLGKDPETQAVIDQFQRTSDPGTGAEFLQQQEAMQPPFRYAWYIGMGYEGSYIPSSAARLEPGTLGVLANGRAVFLGLEEIAGYNPVHLDVYVDYVNTMNGTAQNYHWLDTYQRAFTDSQLLDMLNVRFILVAATLPEDRADAIAIANAFPEVYRDEQVVIYENPDAYPRAWMVHEVLPETDGSGLAQLDTFQVNGRTVAYVHGEVPPVSTGDPGAIDLVAITARTPETMRLEVTANGDGLLVVSEIWEKNWQAYVDDEPVNMIRTNTALRGIPLTSGEHVVELKYESRALIWGMWGTAAGSLGMVAIWTWAAVDRRRSR